MLARFGLASLTSLIAIFAAAAEPSPAIADAGVPDAAVVAAAGLDAGVAALAALPAVVRADEGDGGLRELKLGELNEGVAPEARFEVELPPLKDVRVRLFDEDDKAVSSTDRLELGVRARATLAPTEPLAAGSRYVIAIDGLRSELPTDASGRAWRPVRVELRTSGEKPAPPAGKAKKKPKKHGAR